MARYLTLLDETFHKLADNPWMGRDFDEICQGYRKFKDLIEIVRVLHERMDSENQFSES